MVVKITLSLLPSSEKFAETLRHFTVTFKTDLELASQFMCPCLYPCPCVCPQTSQNVCRPKSVPLSTNFDGYERRRQSSDSQLFQHQIWTFSLFEIGHDYRKFLFRGWELTPSWKTLTVPESSIRGGRDKAKLTSSSETFCYFNNCAPPSWSLDFNWTCSSEILIPLSSIAIKESQRRASRSVLNQKNNRKTTGSLQSLT